MDIDTILLFDPGEYDENKILRLVKSRFYPIEFRVQQAPLEGMLSALKIAISPAFENRALNVGAIKHYASGVVAASRLDETK